MKEKKRGPYDTNWLSLGSAIVAAIKRCELICNPAVVSRPKFTIHVRRMREGPTRSWLVSCSDNGALAGEKGKATKIGILASRNVMARLKQFTTETHLRNSLPQQNRFLGFKYQVPK